MHPGRVLNRLLLVLVLPVSPTPWSAAAMTVPIAFGYATLRSWSVTRSHCGGTIEAHTLGLVLKIILVHGSTGVTSALVGDAWPACSAPPKLTDHLRDGCAALQGAAVNCQTVHFYCVQFTVGWAHHAQLCGVYGCVGRLCDRAGNIPSPLLPPKHKL